MLLGKHKKENNSADATTHHAAEPNSCTYLFRNSNQILSKVDSCSQGHYFICQTGDYSYGTQNVRAEASLGQKEFYFIPLNQFYAFSDQDGSYERNGNSSHLFWRPKKTERETTIPRYKMTSGAPFRATCHQSAHANIVIDEIAGDFSKAIHGLQAHSKLQKACEVLQKLTASLPRFSESTQVSVINSLIYLNEQLLRSPFQNSSDIPVTVCIFRSLSNIMEAGEASQQRPKHNSEQAESILKMPFLPLGKIQEVFLQHIWFSESSVTLTSSVATLMLSSQNISMLPLSSYTLSQPAPVRLGFPSASALEDLLNKHPGVNVQVTGLAFNPFRNFDDKNIVGSIGSVLLSSKHKMLQVNDLMEDIEIMLWRNASMEIHSTSLNMSTDHFVITVNVTSPGKSLIVCIEPESPLLMALYLGFQCQPNHTFFHLNITLPKDQVWQKDEEYTWVLTPESLQYGIGTYYITTILNKSQEHARQTPTWFSVVTAVTQCYFWDHNNSSWKSEGCHVGPQSTVRRTQCLCNHLTYFGSDFFVVPRTVDVGDTLKLILRVTNNPVGVSLLASLLGFYMLIFAWAQRKDRADLQKVMRL